MGKAFIYVDNSNVYAEGCRVSAVNQKLQGVKNIFDAMNRQVSDHDWHLDYTELYRIISGFGLRIECANLWGSPPPKDPFWKYVEAQGFKVVTYDKNVAGKEKKVDTSITYQITKDAFSGKIDKDQDQIFLLAGDTDYVPIVQDLVAEGFIVNVVFWEHLGRELKTVASTFTPLNPHFPTLTKV
jgi:hypothetical protein